MDVDNDTNMNSSTDPTSNEQKEQKEQKEDTITNTKKKKGKGKRKRNIPPKPLPKKIEINQALNNKKKSKKGKKNKKNAEDKVNKKVLKSESSLRRRKRKRLKQKLKDIAQIKQIYATDKSLLSDEQIQKMNQEENIKLQLKSMAAIQPSQLKQQISDEPEQKQEQYISSSSSSSNRVNKAKSHARRIYHELNFISTQIAQHSSQLNEYIYDQNNIRASQTYIGNIKNSLLTLYSRMGTLINDLDSMQYMPLRYTDDPDRPSIYFKNEFMNNEKPFKPKGKLKQESSMRGRRGRRRGRGRGRGGRRIGAGGYPIIRSPIRQIVGYRGGYGRGRRGRRGGITQVIPLASRRGRGIGGPSARLAVANLKKQGWKKASLMYGMYGGGGTNMLPITLSNDEIEKRAMKKRQELKLKTHIMDNYKFFVNRFESYGISHENLLKMIGCDGRINAKTFNKFGGDLLWRYNWNNDDNSLIFSIIQGLVPHSKIYSVNLDNFLKDKSNNNSNNYNGWYRIQICKTLHKMLYNMQCGTWIGNQLEKISLLISKGWSLDCKLKGGNDNNNHSMIAWSQILWNMNLDQYYIRIICFIHDFMNGAINFVDQDGRTLAHFAASIYPANMAYKLCLQMNKLGYSMSKKDIDGITPVFILYCNLLKSYENIISTKNNKEFEGITSVIIQWSLDCCPLTRNLPLVISRDIAEFANYDVASIKNKNWELENQFVNKFVYTSYDQNYWKLMLQKQQKRLEKIKNQQNIKLEKEEKKAKMKKLKKEKRINKEKQRLYLLQKKEEKKANNDDKKDENNNDDDDDEDIDLEMDDGWKKIEITKEKEKELFQSDMKNLRAKTRKNQKRNARKRRKKQIENKIAMEHKLEKLLQTDREMDESKKQKRRLLQQLLNETNASKIIPIQVDNKYKSLNLKRKQLMFQRNNYNNNRRSGRGGYNNMGNRSGGDGKFIPKLDYLENYRMTDNLQIVENYFEDVTWYLNYGKSKRRRSRGRGRGYGRGGGGQGRGSRRNRGPTPYNYNVYNIDVNINNNDRGDRRSGRRQYNNYNEPNDPNDPNKQKKKNIWW